MRLLVIALLALLALFLSFSIINGGSKTITISSAVKEYYVSNTIQFKASIADTTTQDISWSASSGSISGDGLYTAPNKVGPVTITAIWNADNTRTASKTIQIKALSEVRYKWLGSSQAHHTLEAIDKDGNVYLVGYADGKFFGETNRDEVGAFIVKYDKTGNEIWHKWLSFDYGSIALVVTDADGSVYLAGETIFFAVPHPHGNGAYVAKFDSAGNEIWRKELNYNAYAFAEALAIDADGNVYFACNTSDALFGETNKGDRDVFIVKFDKTGNKVWHKWLGSNNNDSAQALSTDADGNIYLAGETSGALFSETNKGVQDAFVVKYDKTGNKVWHKWLGSSSYDTARALATDTNGNVYLAGATKGAFFSETNEGYNDAFVVKYDKTGDEVWHKWLGSNDYDTARALATDTNGNIYLVGYTDGTFFAETNRGSSDAFIVKYDKVGNKIWHKWLGSNDYDSTRALATDTDGNVYLAGAINGALVGETNKGGTDIFIVKFKQ